MIEAYSFGRMRFRSEEYTSDVIIHGNSVTSWWRITGHSVAREDIEEVLSENPAVLVIGTGANGLMKVPPATGQFIEQEGIDVVVEQTAAAVQTFNRLLSEGTDVAIAMHLTC